MFGQGLNFGGLTGGSAPFDAFYLVFAGGGGAGGAKGGNATVYAAGGGGGGYKTNYGSTALEILPSTTYNITVGAGGSGGIGMAAGSNGTSSVFSTITATGGGGGDTVSGGNSGDSPQNTGGTNSSPALWGGGGGGGAGAAGSNGGTNTAGSGGAGYQSIISGTSTYYGGGGGGGIYQATAGSGGSGGGGDGKTNNQNGESGVINTGGGGGGAGAMGGAGSADYSGGSGGSGTVILRYPTADVSSYAVTGTLDTTANTAYPIANTAYYKLNSNANDSSGNGYNGTVNGTVNYAAGRFGNAAVFNNAAGASGSFIQLPNFMPTGSSPRSVSVWIKTTNTLYEEIFAYGSGGTNNHFILRAGAGGSNRIGIAFYANDFDFNAPNILDGNWHHCAATYDGNLAKVYYDGALIGTGTAGSVNTAAGNCKISGYQYSGSIDQVRTFNSAISAGNVTSL